MNNSFFYIDHHIQTDILSNLLIKGPKNFSFLKPDEVENSLFMYHMRKLIDRGLVEKKDGSYCLTPDGARWLNQTGLSRRPADKPRNLIQFMVVFEDKILISKRHEHMAQHMNRYLLPGGLHKFGLTSLESAEEIAGSFQLKPSPAILTQVETIIPDHNSHTIADIYEATTENSDYDFKDDVYKMSYLPIKNVVAMTTNEAGNMPILVSKYLDKSLGRHEEFKL